MLIDRGTPQALTDIKNWMLGDYQLQPFDTVLFAGNDAVAKMIGKVTLHEVVPNLKRPFHRLWTHSGILVDKSVLPLSCLEDGKLYIYESVFSGEVAGMVYSKVMPVDRPVANSHLGPQIRDFHDVLQEVTCDVAICPLSPAHRANLNYHLTRNPRFLLDLHSQYKHHSYPLGNIFKVIASASEKLYNTFNTFKSLGLTSESKSIFCSELVSTIYRAAKLPSFLEMNPAEFSPLELEVAREFDGKVLYVKENGNVLIKGSGRNRAVSSTPRTTTARKVLDSKMHKSDFWVKVEPKGGVPEFQKNGKRTEFAGLDFHGEPLYLARAKIGHSLLIGKIQHGWETPLVSYFDREVPIAYGHEILVCYDGLVWVNAENGSVPPNALVAGMEDDGTFLHAARGELKYQKTVLGVKVGKQEVSLCLGKVAAKGYNAAKMTVDGREVEIPKYQVLCLA
ncbi:UNVERIFIED_CONTAM: hypothetical protein HDU68_009043 [Siphonaria sp. JEL0065]|nr:hypothetical protein HDU68_009043 [Siphonaria sp. JEL0065]